MIERVKGERRKINPNDSMEKNAIQVKIFLIFLQSLDIDDLLRYQSIYRNNVVSSKSVWDLRDDLKISQARRRIFFMKFKKKSWNFLKSKFFKIFKKKIKIQKYSIPCSFWKGFTSFTFPLPDENFINFFKKFLHVQIFFLSHHWGKNRNAMKNSAHD